MSTQDCNGYHRHNSFDLAAVSNTEKDGASSKTDKNENSGTYGDYEPKRMWVQHSDGVMCPVGVRAQGDGRSGSFISYTYYQRIYLWYTHPSTGVKYWYHPNTGTWTTTQTTHSEALRISGNSQDDRYNANVFQGICYEKRSDSSRLSNLQLAVNQLTYKIQNEATESGLDHRIAIVQYGSNSDGSWTNTGMYTNAGTSRVSYTGAGSVSAANYQKAFFKTNQFDTVRTIINNLSASGDTFVDYGFDMAQNIIAHANGVDGNTGYTTEGNRSACIIMITDGCPGFGGNDSATATTVANAAIANAGLAKKNGAYVFTVQLGNNSMSGFDMDKYMDYTSSEYIGSQNLTTPGDRNTNDVNYRLDVPAGSSFNLDNFVDSMFTNVTANSRNALEQLDANSIIREVLGNSFIAPTEAELKANMEMKKVPGYYDGLGRIAFDDAKATNVSYSNSYEQSSRTLTVSGFDYSTEYISKNKSEENKRGNKLVISIKGLLPDSSKQITSGLVTDDFKTAIYQSSTKMSNTTTSNDLAFKHFPVDYISIPEYTYVLDYGLKMLDTDVNGTLCSVSDTLSKQSTYKTVTENGAVEISEDKLDLLYTVSPTAAEQSGYTLIQRDDGSYDWFKINVVPASNVYYEETSMVVKPADEKNAKKKDWTPSKDTNGVTNTYRGLATEDDVDGFDNAYNISNTYSNGTAKTVTVDANNKNTKNYTFDFKGTGVDIISRCGSTTGVMLISVKTLVDGKLKTLKSAVVDTYCAEGTFNQAPIFNWSGDYGTYTVEVGAMYLTTAGALNATNTTKATNKSNLIDTGLVMNSSTSFDTDVLQSMLDEAGVEDVSAEDVELIWFDDNSIFNGGTGVAPTKNGSRADGGSTVQLENYIDGFRVYNPINPDAKEKPDYKETEKNASYVNVVDNLSAISTDDGKFGEIAFITGVSGSFDFATYQKKGPEGELYLNNGKGISFKIDRSANEKVMLGLRAVNGATNISVNDGSGQPWSTTITSATEMYYDVTNCIDSTGEISITVTNTGSTLLAVNHIKFSGGEARNTTGNGARSLTRSNDVNTVGNDAFLPVTADDMAIIENSMSGEPIQAIVRNGVLVPLIEEEEEIPDNTTPDVPEDDTTGDDTTNDDTNTDSGDKEFSIFSLLELIISILEKILYNAFGAGSLF